MITHIVLKMKDTHTQHPILYIVRVGENLKIIKRNRKSDEHTRETEELSTNTKERIKKFKKLLTPENVRKILSVGFKEYRQKQLKEKNLI